MECTKTELNKLISWSSSRYNDMKKADVIKDIIFRIEKGENCTAEYRSGCYSEAANNLKVDCKWTGGNYTLEIKDGINTLKNNVHDVRAVNPEEINIDKPVLNKYFTPAHKIKVTGNPVGTMYWYKYDFSVIGKEFDVIGQSIEAFLVKQQNGTESFIRKVDSVVTESEATQAIKPWEDMTIAELNKELTILQNSEYDHEWQYEFTKYEIIELKKIIRAKENNSLPGINQRITAAKQKAADSGHKQDHNSIKRNEGRGI